MKYFLQNFRGVDTNEKNGLKGNIPSCKNTVAQLEQVVDSQFDKLNNGLQPTKNNETSKKMIESASKKLID